MQHSRPLHDKTQAVQTVATTTIISAGSGIGLPDKSVVDRQAGARVSRAMHDVRTRRILIKRSADVDSERAATGQGLFVTHLSQINNRRLPAKGCRHGALYISNLHNPVAIHAAGV